MAKYELSELKEMILPMIESLGTRRPEELADAIIEIIKQDREALADRLQQTIEPIEKGLDVLERRLGEQNG